MNNYEKDPMIKELQKYSQIFPKAWKRVLDDIEKEIIFPPLNERELQCHLFVECLNIMRKKKFQKPFDIFAEDKEIIKGKKADLSLGLVKDGRFVAVEIKFLPAVDDIKKDLKKLSKLFFKKIAFGFFVMIGPSKYYYRQKINLEDYGIEQEGKHTYYEWRTIKTKYAKAPLETLIVGFGSGARIRI